MTVTTPTAGLPPDTSTTTRPAVARPGQERTVRFRLGRPARRALLVAHIVAAGTWIGIDVVLGVLAITALTTSSTATEAIAYQALDLFVVWPLLIAALATLASGITLGLGTNYGLVRYWWVAVKLAMNIVLVVLIAFVLRPGITDASRHGDELSTGTPSDLDTTGLLFPPIVSLTALTFATILSVYKPWSRIRRRDDDAR